jgi:hypothetical protein
MMHMIMNCESILNMYVEMGFAYNGDGPRRPTYYKYGPISGLRESYNVDI